MYQTLYTAGYTGVSPDDLLKTAQRLNAIIADIRYSPKSRHKQWNQVSLLVEWGERYLYVSELGNYNYKGEYGEGIKLLDPEAGARRIAKLLKVQPVILLCACEDWHTCHRATAAEEIANRHEVTVIHLEKADLAEEKPQQLKLFGD